MVALGMVISTSSRVSLRVLRMPIFETLDVGEDDQSLLFVFAEPEFILAAAVEKVYPVYDLPAVLFVRVDVRHNGGDSI